MALTDKELVSISTISEAITVLEGHYKTSLNGDIPLTLELLRVAKRNINSVDTLLSGPTSVTITWAAGNATDEAEVTIQFYDKNSVAFSGAVVFDFWISEASTGLGLTADTYSGDVTVQTGTELAESVSKKSFRVLTNASGQAVMSLVDSGNPSDQYAVVSLPTGQITVSDVSGSNWEGA